MKNYLSILILLFAGLHAYAQKALTPSEQRKATISALRAELPKADSPRDSLRILYDIMDLSNRNELKEICTEIYNLAPRAGRIIAQFDMLRQFTAITNTPDEVDSLIKVVKTLPDGRDKQETILFLNMKKVSLHSLYGYTDHRQKEISNIIVNLETKPELPADQRVLDLYTLVAYLRNDGNEANGDLIHGYLTQLIDLVSKQHYNTFTIANIIYADAANILSDAGDSKKAVEADRKLLTVIADLEKKYAEYGRKYRNYDISKYVAYRRMLRNYEALTPAEVNDLHAKVMQLAARNSDIKGDLEINPRYYSVYYTASGNYEAAIPYLKKDVAKETGLMLKKKLLQMLQKAAKATGDEATLMEAMSQYNALLSEINTRTSEAKYRELQIMYDVNTLRAENERLQLSKEQEETAFSRDIMTLLCALFIVLAVVLVILLFYWSRFRSNSSQMLRIAKSLSDERDRQRDAEYYDYADKPDPETSKQLENSRTQRRPSKNRSALALTQDMLNDVLYIASIGRKDRIKHVQRISLDQIMREAEANVTVDIHQGVALDVEYPEDNIMLMTDSQCVVYVLSHILHNAARFTQSGTISMKAQVDSEGKSVKFIITDTGEQFAPGHEHFLFENFIDFNNLVDEKASGLFVCRLISLLLKADLKSDKSYSGGERLLLTMPVNLKDNLM